MTELTSSPSSILILPLTKADPENIIQQIKTALEPIQIPTLTYQEFLDWSNEDTRAEWKALPGEEKGDVIVINPASDKHQDISGFLESVLRAFTETHGLGLVRSAPFQMKLATSGREPDVLFITNEHIGRLKPTYLDGPADLVIEIISPESVGRDRGEKFYEYARGEVPEYWLIDPDSTWCEFYQLPDDHYHLVMEGKTGEYHSAVLKDFWLRIEWLWQEPLPPVLDIARTLGLLE